MIELLTSCTAVMGRKRGARKALARRVHWAPQRLRYSKGKTWHTTSTQLDHLVIIKTFQIHYHRLLKFSRSLIFVDVFQTGFADAEGKENARAGSNHLMLHQCACGRCRSPRGPAVPTTIAMTVTRSSDGIRLQMEGFDRRNDRTINTFLC
jgi:hypothetical protein